MAKFSGAKLLIALLEMADTCWPVSPSARKATKLNTWSVVRAAICLVVKAASAESSIDFRLAVDKF